MGLRYVESFDAENPVELPSGWADLIKAEIAKLDDGIAGVRSKFQPLRMFGKQGEEVSKANKRQKTDSKSHVNIGSSFTENTTYRDTS